MHSPEIALSGTMVGFGLVASTNLFRQPSVSGYAGAKTPRVSMLSRTFVSNIDARRLEAEISDERGNIIAIMYEDLTGAHLEFFGSHSPVDVPNEVIKQVQIELSAFVNRTGANAPEDFTRAGLALWLMQKDDGTAMGLKI